MWSTKNEWLTLSHMGGMIPWLILSHVGYDVIKRNKEIRKKNEDHTNGMRNWEEASSLDRMLHGDPKRERKRKAKRKRKRNEKKK